MTDARAAVGANGEALVCADYIADGYSLLDQNWSCKVGELDIVVARGALIVFAEVRTVTTGFIGDPAVTVLSSKQAKVARAADAYLRTHPTRWENVRFDVVSVVLGEGCPQIQRIENAFVPRWAY